MKKTLFIVFVVILPLSCDKAEHPAIYVDNVLQPDICLNGVWKVTTEPLAAFWSDTTRFDEWVDVQVPGELAMQAISIQHDKPFVYKTRVNIPSDYSGKNIYLQFDGVYSYARIWVNGFFVRDHHGGFTRWQCDITPFVRAGETAIITVEVTDRIDDISYASGYAKHCIGGILRDVYLLARPESFPHQVAITTDLDDEHENALLTISGEVNRPAPDGRIELKLTDLHNRVVALETPSIQLSESRDFSIRNTISHPLLWDAEHPNLYQLVISFHRNEECIWHKTYQVGFREIEVEGDRLLVNGRPVKLRGANRHDIHPLLGRSTSPEYDLLDVLLAKEANFNFIRTSHYPPSEAFLKYCDQYGIYVEEETAICFVDTWRSEAYIPFSATQDDTAFTDRYMGQLAEMIERDRNHPSVIIWSIGNENRYGANFREEFDYVRNTDRTRPVMFSYPGFGSDDKIYDLLSMHYAGYKGQVEAYGFKVENFAYPGIPVLHDEWAHVACYNTGTLKSDPNVRDFWGQSLDRMWADCFKSTGALGGAIWGMIDETFMLPDTSVGYGQWGIVDTWRRKKPEFWNTKKAYSPVCLTEPDADNKQPGQTMRLQLQNRFDHTNIRELEIVCNNQPIESPDIAPHETGILEIPDRLIQAGIPLELVFYQNGNLIDRHQYDTSLLKTKENSSQSRESLLVMDDDTEIIISGDRFEIILGKETGLIISASVQNETVIKNGPFVTLIPASNVGDQDERRDSELSWQLEDISWDLNDDTTFTATISGQTGEFSVTYNIRISNRAEILLDYEVSHQLQSASQAGIYFLVAGFLDQVSWDRQSYWSYYPEGHLGRPHSVADKFSDMTHQEQYRKSPPGRWESDTKDFYLFGVHRGFTGQPVTHDFRATKMNVIHYALVNEQSQIGLEIAGDGSLSCRTSVEEDNSEVLYILGHLCYPDLAWGNYVGETQIENPFRSNVHIKLAGQ